MESQTTEVILQPAEKKPLNYEAARNSIFPLKRTLDKCVLNGEIERYSLILTGGSVYEPREPSDLDLFVVYKPTDKTKTPAAIPEIDELITYDGQKTIIQNKTAEPLEKVIKKDYQEIREMVLSSSSGHRRLDIDGVEVDVQVDSEEQFLRILHESSAHAKFRLLGKKGILYMACDRDDVPDKYRKAVWFLSPLLAAADKKVNSKLSTTILEYHNKISTLYEKSEANEVVKDSGSVFNEDFASYLTSLGCLSKEEASKTVARVAEAFRGKTDLNRPELKSIFNKMLISLLTNPDLPYTFTKSLKTKVNNYWNGENFVSHGLKAGAILIGGSNIEDNGEDIFKKVDNDFLREK